MAAPDERWVTAEMLYERFKEAISARRPRPDIDLCADLEKQINQYRPIFDHFFSLRDYLARARKDQARVAKAARRLVSALRQLPTNWEQIADDGDGDDILTTVTKIVDCFGPRRVRIKEAKADL